MPGKLYVFSSKSENMRRVFERLVYGANARRPEQRGILGVSRGDIVLLYDTGKRMLIGPFIARGDVYYSETRLWSGHDWCFVVPLRPLMGKVGYLGGKKLLDLIVEAGKLSLRDRYTIDTYWINTLLAGEAESVLEKFYELAVFETLNALAMREYGVKNIVMDKPRGEPIEDTICRELRSSRPGTVGEWIYEAALVITDEAARELVGDAEAVRATGVFLYARRYLDVIYLSDKMFNAVIEVKKSGEREDLAKAIDQASYYTYSITKGLGLPKEKTWTIIALGKTTPGIAEEFKRLVKKKSNEYGLREDMFMLIEIELKCRDNKIEQNIRILA